MNVVIDASAFIRAAERHAEASVWIERIDAEEVEGHAPELIYAEVANGEVMRVRSGMLDLDGAEEVVDVLRKLPLAIMPLSELAVPALRVAARLGLSVYDACYVALADVAQATLLTADRRLASAASPSILLD